MLAIAIINKLSLVPFPPDFPFFTFFLSLFHFFHLYCNAGLWTLSINFGGSISGICSVQVVIWQSKKTVLLVKKSLPMEWIFMIMTCYFRGHDLARGNTTLQKPDTENPLLSFWSASIFHKIHTWIDCLLEKFQFYQIGFYPVGPVSLVKTTQWIWGQG